MVTSFWLKWWDQGVNQWIIMTSPSLEKLFSLGEFFVVKMMWCVMPNSYLGKHNFQKNYLHVYLQDKRRLRMKKMVNWTLTCQKSFKHSFQIFLVDLPLYPHSKKSPFQSYEEANKKVSSVGKIYTPTFSFFENEL